MQARACIVAVRNGSRTGDLPVAPNKVRVPNLWAAPAGRSAPTAPTAPTRVGSVVPDSFVVLRAASALGWSSLLKIRAARPTYSNFCSDSQRAGRTWDNVGARVDPRAPPEHLAAFFAAVATQSGAASSGEPPRTRCGATDPRPPASPEPRVEWAAGSALPPGAARAAFLQPTASPRGPDRGS